jgi:hypothetical protein
MIDVRVTQYDGAQAVGHERKGIAIPLVTLPSALNETTVEEDAARLGFDAMA